MGNGMDKILPGLYVGNIRDSFDIKQIKDKNITHIISIHDEAKPGNIENVKYLCFQASDTVSQDLQQFFVESIHFIHSARINNGNVLVHCLAGVSRSATIAISYIMVVTSLPWYDAMNAAREARSRINPNFGFQRQLQNFEFTNIKTIREELFKKFGDYDNSKDIELCMTLLKNYQQKQKEFLENSNNQQQVNAQSVNTYPLAFNSYKFNKEEVKNNIKKYRKKKSTENEMKSEPESLQNDEKSKEKEIIMEKLFG